MKRGAFGASREACYEIALQKFGLETRIGVAKLGRMWDIAGGVERMYVLRQLGIWTLICSVSAAPSFYVGALSDAHPGGMVVGVGIFILLYTGVSCMAGVRRFVKRPRVKRTVQIGYCTRVAMSVLSVIPPVMVVDFFCGVASVVVVSELTQRRMGDDLGFGRSVATTLVQGVLLNIVLFVYMLMVLGVVAMVMKKRPRAGVCARCGYDLRASAGRCPECGEEIMKAKEM